ncbi:MAG: hypothetical protein JWP91_1448 [Fibrobacteres bacterium]|nr:hypothetical protein [Fibrobacterota bacterium]
MESADNLPPIGKRDSDLALHERKASLAKAQMAGAAAGFASALAWGLVTYAIQYVVGYFAIGVGVLVGYCVKRFGKGSGKVHGTVAGFYALLGCVLGNLFCLAFFVADQENLPLVRILFVVDFYEIFKAYLSEFDVMDLVFYGIAVSSAYKIGLNPGQVKAEPDHVLDAKTAAAAESSAGEARASEKSGVSKPG